jgi:hypothetical protein
MQRLRHLAFLLVIAGAVGACATDRAVAPRTGGIKPEISAALERSGATGMVAVAEFATIDGIQAVRIVRRIDDQLINPGRGSGFGLRTLDADEQYLAFVVNPSPPNTGNLPYTITINWSFYCYNYSTNMWQQQFLVTINNAFQKAVANTGGHLSVHSLPAKPIGTWDPHNGATSGGVFSTKYTAKVASGDEEIHFDAVVNDDPSPCKGPVEFLSESATRVRGLVQITSARVTYETITSDHSSVFYATPTSAARIDPTAIFYDSIQHQTMRVNAASLPFGGVNDVNHNWAPPHSLHRVGKDVDIDGSADTQRIWDKLIKAATTGGGFRSCEVHDRNHVHCYQ